MPINRQLKMISLVVLVIALVGSATIWQSLQAYLQAFEKSVVATKIATGVFEQRLFGEEYLQTQGERPKAQWLAKQASITLLLDTTSAQFSSADEQELITEISATLQDREAAFQSLVELFQTDPNNGDQKNRLSSQLSIKAQTTVSAATTLANINTEEVTASLQRVLLLFSTVASIFFVMLAASLWLIWRSASQLEHARSQDEAILNGIGDAVFAVDKARRIILFNPVAAELSTYDQAQAIGKPYQDVLNFSVEGKTERNDEFIRTALDGNKTAMANHTVIIRPDGTAIAVSDSAAPIKADDGTTVGAVVIFRDVTKERAVDRMKSEFISLASHQLKTPLTAINWTTELLQKDITNFTPKQKQRLQDIIDLNQHMNDLVNTLLNVSRIESGRLIVEPRLTNLNQLIQEVVTELESKVHEKQMQVKLVTTATLPLIKVDPKLMREVYVNLLSNAIKYTPANGNITITIAKQAETILLSIADTGYGIPQAEQKRVFQKFYRGENITQTGIDGTGLGLYLVKSIVETSGGSIWFESIEGKGTTFFVSLPLGGSQPHPGEVRIN